uniref:Uncharacterized protein n=1 Tax=Oryza brachyantha TaxID=4533 RepID=J3MSU9_ORYBR
MKNSKSFTRCVILFDITSHDGAGVGVVVAEEGGEALLLAWGDRHHGVHAADVARRRSLVVRRRRRHVGVGVGHVGPQLHPLPRRLRPPQHPLRLHHPLHRHLRLLPVYLHRLHPCTCPIHICIPSQNF